MKSRILIVDDEESTRRLLEQFLTQGGHHCTVAAGAQEARRELGEQEFVLILCDVNMPGESGLHLVRHVLKEHPQTAAVMVTGLDDPKLADVALEMGVYGYILKPFEANEVLIAVANALHRRRLEMENQAYRERLEQLVLERTAQLQGAVRRLEHAAEETIHRLSLAVEFRDKETSGHLRRMSQYCALLADRYGVAPHRCELIRMASPMHDIGKIAIPRDILLKPGKLSAEEYKNISQHTEIGYQILRGSETELLQLAATIALNHHERFDGTGYPQGLAGEAIPLEGRIAAIADAFDALSTARAYKPAFPIDQTIEAMRAQRAKQFDPALLDLFLNSMEEVMAIKARYAEEKVEGCDPSAT